MGNPILLIVVAAVMFAVIGGITLVPHLYNQQYQIQDGQRGTACFSTQPELHRIFKLVPYGPKAWRKASANNKELHLPQGVIVGCQNITDK